MNHPAQIGGRLGSLLTAVILVLLFPVAAAAHPLGNFTVNHYAGIRVSPTRIDLDVVVDLAEIPAFQERIRIDSNGDGDVSQAEADAAREAGCEALRGGLHLGIGGHPGELGLVAAGISFPAGAGGVPTMRTVCEFTVDGSFAKGSGFNFADTTDPGRLGWREIVVQGDGVAIGPAIGSPLPTGVDRSSRLTAYPKELLATPLDDRSVAFTISGTGPPIRPFSVPDAGPLTGPSAVPTFAAPTTAGATASVTPAPTPGPSASVALGVPGGVGDIPDLFRADLTPLVVAASFLLAMALGAGHALTPGHGKTLMAAYVVGVRGTFRHAVGLGLVVAVAHTMGIVLLALLATSAESLLPPDLVVRAIPVLAALGFVAVGALMLVSEVRRRRADHTERHDHAHVGGAGHRHDPPDDAALGDTPGFDGPRLDRRNLIAIGFAGGVVPSANALIILLAAMVVGRVAFGILLVLAFGLGMAIVLGGVGALTVLARGRLDRMTVGSSFGWIRGNASLAAAVIVLGVGLWLTAQSLAARPTL